MKRLEEMLTSLKHITALCRTDMHEPDEQHLKAHIVGDHLDNATGGLVDVDLIRSGSQEYVVCFERYDEEAEEFLYADINLADLIALARMAVIKVEAARR